MNYGYEPTPFDKELARDIDLYLLSVPPDDRGQRPYVELNQLYKGVRIRRLTHYPHDVIKDIVEHCDQIYKQYEKNGIIVPVED